MLTDARARAADLNATPIGAGGGATLRFLASVVGARNVVEIGTGCGVSGVWLMRGMRDDGVLTSVDVEAEHQRLAQEAFAAAGFPPQRVRLIPGAALDVLPRLTDRHYDLVFCDGDKQEYPRYLEQALGSCAQVGWWPSTTRCGMTGSLTRRCATRTRWRSARRSTRCARTSDWFRCSSRSATGCSSRRNAPTDDGRAGHDAGRRCVTHLAASLRW